MRTGDQAKRAFRPADVAAQGPGYPDLESVGKGRWVRAIAGALCGAALMAFTVSCNSNAGFVVGDSAPLDISHDLGPDLDGGPDSDLAAVDGGKERFDRGSPDPVDLGPRGLPLE